MLIAGKPGEPMTGGPLDFICILRDVEKGTYHPCFVEEHPMPGPVPDVDETPFVRAKSKMHHTTGFATFEEAVENVTDDFSKKLLLPPENVATSLAVDWDSSHMIFTVILPNWRKEGKNIEDVLTKDSLM